MKNSQCAIFVYFEEDIKIKAGKKSTIYPIGLWPIVNKVVYTVIGKPYKDGFQYIAGTTYFQKPNIQFDFSKYLTITETKQFTKKNLMNISFNFYRSNL